MDNMGKKLLRDLAANFRKKLAGEFSGRHETAAHADIAWLWAVRLITESVMAVRKINSPLPAFLAIAGFSDNCRPSEQCLDSCRSMLTGPEYAPYLSCDDVIGWFHQYWHDSERQEITANVIKNGYNKIADKEVISRTQVYSEKYMSDYLLQNSLGALWLEAHPASTLRSGWFYYAGNTGEPNGTAIPACEITIIDPACGAGNFLLAAFDMLYLMYLEEGNKQNPRDICSSILNNNIFGIDIDAKAIEVARTALWLKAVEKAPDLAVCDLYNFCSHLAAACEDNANKDAAELGSLLHIANNPPGGKLTKLLRRRYQVVITNPPYLDKRDYGKLIRDHLRRYYRSGAGNLYAAFILRCIELSENYISMITPQTFLFIKSYTNLRRDIFCNANITTLAHLGLGAFEGAVVDTAMFVLKSKNYCQKDSLSGIYFKLVDSADKNKALLAATAKLSADEKRTPDNVFKYIRDIKDNLSGAPVTYWLGQGLMETINNSPQLKEYADIVLGMKTSDNKRYVRFWWEIAGGHGSILREWLPYEKEASGYRFFRNSAHYVLWTEKARAFYQGHYSGQLPNPKYWLKPGIVFGLVSSKAFTAKILPAGHMSDMAASCVFPKNPADTMFILALLNSKIYQWMLKTFNPTVNYQPVDVQRLPVPDTVLTIKELLASLAEKAAMAAEALRKNEITDRGYIFGADSILPINAKLPELVSGIWSNAICYVLAQDTIDIKLAESMGLTEKEVYDIENDIGTIASRYNINKHAEYFEAVITGDLARLLSMNNLPVEDKHGLKVRLKELYIQNWQRGGGYFPPDFIVKSARQLRIHPLSLYDILLEGIEQDGWRCPNLEKQIVEDYFSALVLKLLGFNWPDEKQRERAGHCNGFFAIGRPLCGHSLYRQVCAHIESYCDINDFEAEFSAIIGVSLQYWLEKVFFNRHIKQFRRRPIVWQISSQRKRSVLSWLVNYHKINLLNGLMSEFLPQYDQVDCDTNNQDLIDFKDSLKNIADFEFDYSLGVRANIAPLQLAGLLSAKVLTKEDAQAAMADYRVWPEFLL